MKPICGDKAFIGRLIEHILSSGIVKVIFCYTKLHLKKSKHLSAYDLYDYFCDIWNNKLTTEAEQVAGGGCSFQDKFLSNVAVEPVQPAERLLFCLKRPVKPMLFMSWTWIAFYHTHRHGCCCFWLRPVTRTRLWSAAVTMSAVTWSFTLISRQCCISWHVTLSVVISMVCKAHSVARDWFGCSFVSMHVEREFNIAKCMCGSLLTNLRESL